MCAALPTLYPLRFNALNTRRHLIGLAMRLVYGVSCNGASACHMPWLMHHE